MSRSTASSEETVRVTGQHSAFKSSVALLAAASLLPLAAGYAREAAAAFALGTTAAADAFAVAFLYVDGIAAVASVGIASYALVPVFAVMLSTGRSAESFRLMETVSAWIILAMAPVVAVSYLQPTWVVGLLAPGFAGGQRFLMAQLVPAAALSATLVLLGAVVAGNLQARADYTWPVLGRALLASCVASGLVAGATSRSLRGVALGLVIGSVLQLLLQLWRLRRAGWSPAWPRWMHPDLKGALALGLPALVATLLTNVLMGGAQAWLGSGLSEGSLSSVNYALRTLNLVSTLTMAVATVALTELSIVLRKGDGEGAPGVRLLGDSLETGVFLLAPFVGLLLVWAEPVLRVLFKRGSYDSTSLTATASCLRWYALAIIPGFFNTILLRTQPALGRPWALLQIAAVWAVSTVAATAVLLRTMGAAAIPAGFLVGQVVACTHGAVSLRSLVGGELLSRVGSYLLRATAVVLAAVAVSLTGAWVVTGRMGMAGDEASLGRAAVTSFLMFTVYGLSCAGLHDPHFRQFLAAARSWVPAEARVRPVGEVDR